MSIIATLLSWTGLSTVAQEAIFAAAIAIITGGGFAIYHHHVVEIGVHEQETRDAAATKKLNDQTAALTAAGIAKADAAEHAHDDEITQLKTYRDSHPDGPVRLCLADNRGKVVPSTGATHTGNESTGPSAGGVQPMPAGNHSSGSGSAGPDIFPMLDALAAQADNVSASLREFQRRTK